jgi:hypothetical protein
VESEQKRVQTSSADAQTIEEDRWIAFLDEFTRENRGAHARLGILNSDLGSQVEAENRPFDGISADTRAGERNVSIAFGSLAGDHFEHVIEKVAAIRLRPAAGQSGPALEVVSRDGTKALLELSSSEAYELPPAAQ